MAEGWKYCLRYGDERLELTEGKMTVGRSRHCDLSIQEPSISRKHVFFTVGSGRIDLQDLGSSNGTFINEIQASGETPLFNGDVLRLGNAQLWVEIRSRLDGDSHGANAAEPPSRPFDTSVLGDFGSDSGAARPAGSSRLRPLPPDSGALPPEIRHLPEDPDAEPTKRLDSGSIHWDVLQGERAGLRPRLGALVCDGLWAAALSWAGWQFAGQRGVLAVAAILMIVTWLGWGIWGTTPGKRLFGLYVYAIDAEEPGRPGTGLVISAIRLVACLLSLLLFGLGFLAVAFSPSRLALHDRLAGTFVLRGSASS